MDPITRLLMQGAAGAAGEKVYVEDVFSTWLYTGNGSTQTITNGIDLSGEGGMVWIKCRSNVTDSTVADSVRGLGSNGAYLRLFANLTLPEQDDGYDVTALNTDGFSLTPGGSYSNLLNRTYASWTFRKAEKFFDVVTYVGNGDNSRDIAHNLGSKPGFIIIKRTDSTSDWAVWHRGNGTDAHTYLSLNRTNSSPGWSGYQGYATATTFNVGTSYISSATETCNVFSATYVAYLFAHDAGGFGDSGNESVVKCGSYTGNGSTSGPTIDLGWEPQWLLVKNATSAGNNWVLIDNMRGFSVTGNQWLYPNDSAAEATTGLPVAPLATGFQPRNSGTFVNESGSTYIYIAIRRGPMKTPTDATKVFSALSTSISANPQDFPTNFPVDFVWTRDQTGADSNPGFAQRLTNTRLVPDSTAAESTTSFVAFDFNTKVTGSYFNPGFGTIQCMSAFRRAPGFFDVVAYTGTGVARTVSHNLGVVPELMIVKTRSDAGAWLVYTLSTGAGNVLRLDLDNASGSAATAWNNTAPTASLFTVGTSTSANGSGRTYVAYLLATCPGVSKVGSYTGTGTTQQINCGFTAGARFVLIKRTDSTGDWYVYDSARGIVSGNDPYLLLNSTAAEVTSTDYIDPLSSGFQITSTAPAAINASGGSFIFLAIA